MSRDQRASFRFALPEGQDEAVLRAGRKRVMVRVLNASATGFLLACPNLDVTQGQRLWLRTSAAWTEIRVVFIELDDDGLQLGVERLGELDEHATPSGAWWMFGAWLPADSAAGSVGNLTIALSVLATTVVAGMFLHWEWDRSNATQSRFSVARMLADMERSVQRTSETVGDAAARLWPGNLFESSAAAETKSQVRGQEDASHASQGREKERLTAVGKQISKNPSASEKSQGVSPRPAK